MGALVAIDYQSGITIPIGTAVNNEVTPGEIEVTCSRIKAADGGGTTADIELGVTRPVLPYLESACDIQRAACIDIEDAGTTCSRVVAPT